MQQSVFMCSACDMVASSYKLVLVFLIFGYNPISVAEETHHLLWNEDYRAPYRAPYPISSNSASNSYVCGGNESAGCSQWSSCVNGTCSCPRSLDELLECDDLGHFASKVTCACVTHNSETESTVEVGLCAYGCGYFDLPDDDFTAFDYLNDPLCLNFKRRGTLCARCVDGYFPRVHSYNLSCVKCTDEMVSWWKYLLSFFLPLTVFYFMIVYFKFNILSSSLHGYTMFCQIVCSPMFLRVYSVTMLSAPVAVRISVKIILTICGIWSLDFFRMYNHWVCLQTDALLALSLNFLVGLYPLLLIIVTFLLVTLYDDNFKLLVFIWKPFGKFFHLFKESWDIKTSLIDAFVSFLVMSNVKFISVCFDLLVPVSVYHFIPPNNVTHSWRLYYDATVPYFGKKHLPYATLALLVFFTFSIIPVLLFVFYTFDTFQKVLRIFPRRWQIFLHTFIDAFQGSYNNGSIPGTQDCRWFCAVPFLLHFTICTLYSVFLNPSVFPILAILFVLAVILTLQVNPFRPGQERLFFVFMIFALFGALVFSSMAAAQVPGFGHSCKLKVALQYSTVILAVIHLLYIVALLLLQLTLGCKKIGLMLIEAIVSKLN